MSVFLTDGTWSITHAAIASLGAKNIKIVSGDTLRHFSIFRPKVCSKYITYPSPESDFFDITMYDILEKNNIDSQ